MSKQQRPRLLAIDWSGAKKPSDVASGIAVAVLEPDDVHVKLLGPPDGWQWTRQGVLELLKERATDGTPTVAGIDCNFSLPFTDCGEYLPGLQATTAHALWAEIESVCSSDSDFYGGAFSNVHKDHFPTSGTKNYKFRFRATEEAARACGVKPQSPFNLAQRQAQVGKGGLAGMRMLNCLQDIDGVSIWPFDERDDIGPLTVVEIFPTLYRHAAGIKGNSKIGSRNRLDKALDELGFKFNSCLTHSLSGDDTDALISVAGMAQTLKNYPQVLRADGIDAKVRKTEGWIFGVPWPEKGC